MRFCRLAAALTYSVPGCGCWIEPSGIHYHYLISWSQFSLFSEAQSILAYKALGSSLLSVSSLSTPPNHTLCSFSASGSLHMLLSLTETSFLPSHLPSPLMHSHLLIWFSNAKIISNARDFCILSSWTDYNSGNFFNGTSFSMIFPRASGHTFFSTRSAFQW